MSLNIEDEAFGYPGGAEDYRSSRAAGLFGSYARRTRDQADQIVRDFERAVRECARAETAQPRERNAASAEYEKARARLIADLVV